MHTQFDFTRCVGQWDETPISIQMFEGAVQQRYIDAMWNMTHILRGETLFDVVVINMHGRIHGCAVNRINF